MKRSAALFVALIAVVGLAGCSSLSSAQPTVMNKSSVSASASESPTQTHYAAFGDTVKMNSGLQVLAYFTGWHTIAYGGGDIAVLALEVTNPTGKEVDASLMDGPTVLYGSPAQNAEFKSDSDVGIGNGSLGLITPGQTQKMTYGYNVPRDQASKLQVQVTDSDIDNPKAIFEGSL